MMITCLKTIIDKWLVHVSANLGEWHVGLQEALAIAYTESAATDDIEGIQANASSIKDRIN
jgi:hypothetical protein